MKKLFLTTAVFFVCFALAFSQDGSDGSGSFGVVIYAEGDVVYIIRDGRRLTYDAFTGELLGLPIFGGDIIQTDPGTYLEIQLLPSRSVVKVAENTSFTVQQVSASGDGVFGLAYGRLRARVSRLTGTDPFEIRGIGTVAGVRGTDFGTDVVITRSGSDTVTRIYCFEGEIEVTTTEPSPIVDPAESDVDVDDTTPEPIVVAANQMVTSVRTVRPPAVFGAEPQDERTPEAAPTIGPVEEIEPEIQSYWQREDFAAEVKDTNELLEDFPFLEDDVRQRLGTVDFLDSRAPAPQLQEAEPPAVEEPAVAVEQVTESPPAAEEAVTLETGDEQADPERARRLIGATRATGITLISLGALADIAAVTAFYWGDDIINGFDPASYEDQILSVAAAGGVFLIGGILSLLFSAQLSN